VNIEKLLDLREFRRLFNKRTWLITHGDWDGICAAALLRAFVRERLNWDIKAQKVLFSKPKLFSEERIAMGYNAKKQKIFHRRVPYTNMLILDLPYLRKASLWVDHHDANYLPPPQLNRCRFCAFDDTSASATQLVSRVLRTEFQFEIPDTLVLFTNEIDSGAYGKKWELDDLDALPMMKKLCYLTEGLRGRSEMPLSFHILDLVTENFRDLNAVEDPTVEAKFQEIKERIQRGRQAIRDGEYYHGLLIIEPHKFEEKTITNYWDILPIFYKEVQPRLANQKAPLLGTLFIRNEWSCRLAIPWRKNPRLVTLKNDGLLNIRHIAQTFGGDGHYNVVGFMLQGLEDLAKVKEVWDRTIEQWGFHF
jgi:hypothetical protein